jgi:large subunit ribosomal protein L6
MSRIGNAPVAVPKGVTVTTTGRTISAKGPKGTLSFDVPAEVSFENKDGVIRFKRSGETQKIKAMHGMARARTAAMMTGVSTGFTRELEINGVGYRAAVKGQSIDLTLGYSHGISVKLPASVKAEVTKEGKLILTGPDAVELGQVAADIRGYRGPEPYKGKGIKYLEETILRKEGKRGKK